MLLPLRSEYSKSSYNQECGGRFHPACHDVPVHRTCKDLDWGRRSFTGLRGLRLGLPATSRTQSRRRGLPELAGGTVLSMFDPAAPRYLELFGQPVLQKGPSSSHCLDCLGVEC